MTTLIAILGCAVLSLVNPVSLEPCHYGNDYRLSRTDDVLATTDTPVFFFRSVRNSSRGHTLIEQYDAIDNLILQSPFFNLSRTAGIVDCTERAENPTSGTVYLHFVVVVDYGIYQRYENQSNKLTKLLEYVLAYWNGVDLNFMTLKNPNMRIHIAGIIVEEHADELPFLSIKHTDGRLIGRESAHSLDEFLKSNGSSWSHTFERYDTVVVMTSKKITAYYERDGPDEPYSFTYHGGTEEGLMEPLSFVLSVDEGWLGIRALSFGVGKIFAGNCPRGESAVENYNPPATTDLPDWSECYRKSFPSQLLLWGVEYGLRLRPRITSPLLPRALYGEILDCNSQCRITKGTKCCMDESICQDLKCQTEDGCKPIGIYAADGTICGDGKICFRRRCEFRKDIE